MCDFLVLWVSHHLYFFFLELIMFFASDEFSSPGGLKNLYYMHVRNPNSWYWPSSFSEFAMYNINAYFTFDQVMCVDCRHGCNGKRNMHRPVSWERKKPEDIFSTARKFRNVYYDAGLHTLNTRKFKMRQKVPDLPYSMGEVFPSYWVFL